MPSVGQSFSACAPRRFRNDRSGVLIPRDTLDKPRATFFCCSSPSFLSRRVDAVSAQFFSSVLHDARQKAFHLLSMTVYQSDIKTCPDLFRAIVRLNAFADELHRLSSLTCIPELVSSSDLLSSE